MTDTGHAIPLAGGFLRRDCHVCAFFNSVDEQYRVLGAFIRDGLDGGEKTIHIVDPSSRDEHLERLGDAGIDLEHAMATGQLEVMTWEETHLYGGRFDQDAVLQMLEASLNANAASGYPLTRIVAHMEWAALDKPGVEDLLDYEARVNQVLAKHYAPAICAYDLSKFSASTIMDVLRTHPVAIIAGVLQENPFYVPPEQMLVELRRRKRSARLAESAVR